MTEGGRIERKVVNKIIEKVDIQTGRKKPFCMCASSMCECIRGGL